LPPPVPSGWNGWRLGPPDRSAVNGVAATLIPSADNWSLPSPKKANSNSGSAALAGWKSILPSAPTP
jgi:hypothetical protein